ncbi:hypothetical protein A5677_09155 [Mycobacterium malmoense]|uniref:Uncharacterized protein n=1 Tax=Mycobacterium malmoense TaxID=1780 RepID=A0A1B9CH64_MYCMA|nr:hypothetical protein A5677_09155 [Mycobacterium malmoense]
MLLVQDQQRPKARPGKEIQTDEVEDQRGFQPRKAANRLRDEVGVGGVDLAVDAQDGGHAAGVHVDLRSGAIDLVAAAGFSEQPGCRGIGCRGIKRRGIRGMELG